MLLDILEVAIFADVVMDTTEQHKQSTAIVVSNRDFTVFSFRLLVALGL